MSGRVVLVDALRIEQIMRESGLDGISQAELRRRFGAPDSFTEGRHFAHTVEVLERAGTIVSTLEQRPDTRGAMREQRVWRLVRTAHERAEVAARETATA